MLKRLGNFQAAPPKLDLLLQQEVQVGDARRAGHCERFLISLRCDTKITP